MPRLLLTALIAAIAAVLIGWVVRGLQAAAQDMRARAGHRLLGESPMQRLSFMLLCALILYAAIWGAG